MGRNSGTSTRRKVKTKSNPVGRAMIKSKFGGARNTWQNDKGGAEFHTTTMDDQPKRDLRSMTEMNDLAAFLDNAVLADRDFTAERGARVVDSTVGIDATVPKTSVEERREVQVKLTIPVRPPWRRGEHMSIVDKREREYFLEWRRSLAQVEAEHPGVVLTPFEKNIEVWRQLWRTVERAEVVVQIVDGRNPLMFFCPQLAHYVKAMPGKREFVVLVNKADLLPDRVRQKWAAYFRGTGVRYAFWSAAAELAKIEEEGVEEPVEPEDLEAHRRRLFEAAQLDESPLAAEGNENVVEKVLDRDGLYDLLISLRPRYEAHEVPGTFAPGWGDVTSVSGARPSVVVGLVGFPNVGKTSTLNVLVGEKCAAVSATPGKTKHFQTFRVDREVMICDCPGLVFPSVAATKADMICNGILPIDQMRNHRDPMTLLARRIPRAIIEATYGVILPKPRFDEDQNRPPTGQEVSQAVAYNRGFMTSAGNPDESRIARILLKDLVRGKLLHYLLPEDPDNAVFVPPGFTPTNTLPAARRMAAQRDGDGDTKGKGKAEGEDGGGDGDEDEDEAMESPIPHPHLAAALERISGRTEGLRPTYIEPNSRPAEVLGGSHGRLQEVRALTGKRRKGKKRMDKLEGKVGRNVIASGGVGQSTFIRKDDTQYAPVPISELRKIKQQQQQQQQQLKQQQQQQGDAGASGSAGAN